ncbi:hypothetical protein COV15_00370 [Candidatus Woesearchaeota archaeon CG10_big_fil_rev_8_21_14_0_10_34_12]|nr:MAG: hypothetical protein COV15_00370 [Candidatus Woesearchaeota archaeon CG10_big_fil_rev_8_21_14_0_10_34_12]
MKKAVTPIIATVLLIAIVVVASLIVFIWANSFIKERIMKLDQLAETLCPEVILAAGLEGNTLVVSNLGNIPVYQIRIKKIKDKESQSENIATNLNVGEIFEKNLDLTSTTQIIITPRLLGKVKEMNKVYMCDERMYSTTLDVTEDAIIFQTNDDDFPKLEDLDSEDDLNLDII